MSEPQHRVDRLHLRAPGSDESAGTRLADHVNHTLEGLPAPTATRELGALRLRVRVGAGASEAEISRAVADALTRALR